MKIALTGHQPSRLRGNEATIAAWLGEIMLFLACGQGRIELLCGGAPGADMLWAKFFRDCCNEEYCGLWLYEGYEGQCKDKKVRKMASKIWWATEKGKMLDDYNFVKDCRMVDDCDVLLAIWDGVEEGGTWRTIQYAREQGKIVLYCPPGLILKRETV